MSRFAIFLTTVLLIWAAMHSYVFWRLSSLPWISKTVPSWAVTLTGLILWLSYPVARMIESRAPDALALPIEYLAANWMGVLFLLLCGLLTADILTLGGWLWPSKAPLVRSFAAGAALVLSAIALAQGHRDPVVSDYEVTLPGLPKERDKTVLVAFSDIHLGTLIRERWLSRMVSRVNALKPDIIVAAGDVVDGNAGRAVGMAKLLGRLEAPLGVWGVTGNHDYYAGIEESVRIFEQAGIKVLRDDHAEVAPGLVIAGVDDLTARAQFGAAAHPADTALAGRPAGGVVYLSHTPWDAGFAAMNGAGLMISGHTHNGQIWPFSYFVRTRYPLVCGRYEVDGMTVIVGRGTATWGPRMRLWRRGELLRITLRSGARTPEIGLNKERTVP
jgi:predicted MPP superfamily phosphohydrolase